MLRLSADPCIVGMRRDLGELEEVTTELQRKEAVGEAQRVDANALLEHGDQ